MAERHPSAAGDRPAAIDSLLATARTDLDRVEPADLYAELAPRALVIDTRPTDQRERDGALPGALVVDRNVLEWRLDPSCPYRLMESTDPDQRIITVCNQGYRSSLAAQRDWAMVAYPVRTSPRGTGWT